MGTKSTWSEMMSGGGGKAKKKKKKKKKKAEAAKPSIPAAQALDMSLDEYGSL